MKLNGFFEVLDKLAPIELSKKMIEKGDYDNSGILVKHHENVEKVMFSLDLSVETVKKAKRQGCDTVVTHHPAIYTPIKGLDTEGDTAALLLATNYGMNVISMHLNLDLADGGTDMCLAKAMGCDKYKLIDHLDEAHGYGREYSVRNMRLVDVKKHIRKALKTQRVISYGKYKEEVKKVASFCGGGANYALDYVRNNMTEADLIVTSDMPHHVIKELVERGKKIILITHYSSENCGFKEFYANVSGELKGKIQSYYFEDRRFL